MPSGLSSGQLFRFGVFEADVANMTLTRKGVRVKIQEQPFRILVLLLERPGEIVTREELRQALWPDGIHVDFDGSLNATLKKLRAALDDSSGNPVFIETVPRWGYRFIAPVSLAGSTPEVATALDREPSTAVETSNPEPAHRGSRGSSYLPLWILSGLLLLIAMLGIWRLTPRTAPNIVPRRRTVAVLPFTNAGAASDFDYLGYAIASDLVSDLMSTHSVSVRPFASTKKYESQRVDPATAGRELQVTDVVTGTYLPDGNKLRVNIELIDVAQNRVIWADEVNASPEHLVALHEQLALRAAHGLLETMNVRNASPEEMPSARNEEALNLFLHSLTIPLDPGPNQVAIKNLEESVSLDNQYGPAWEELGWRYYIDYSYGDGGEAALAKALQASRRAQEFPNSMANAITIRVEQGDLDGAYKEAAGFLRSRPELGYFHYEMSYVLRYAGLLPEAGAECDAALTLDPGYNLYRSCATPFILEGEYDHALRYIRLDENSGFGAKLRMLIALRTGNNSAALAEAGSVSQTGYKFADVARLYLNRAPQRELQNAVAQLEADPRSARDPEVFYLNAAVLSFSKQPDAAFRELRRAINGNHCSYPAMDKDPLFDAIRQRPEFTTLRAAAMQCQEHFLDYRRQVDGELQTSH